MINPDSGFTNFDPICGSNIQLNKHFQEEKAYKILKSVDISIIVIIIHTFTPNFTMLGGKYKNKVFPHIQHKNKHCKNLHFFKRLPKGGSLLFDCIFLCLYLPRNSVIYELIWKIHFFV